MIHACNIGSGQSCVTDAPAKRSVGIVKRGSEAGRIISDVHKDIFK